MASNEFQSSVRVTAFSIFKRRKTPDATGSPVDVLYGASSGRFGDDGKLELLADSVPFHSVSFKNKAPKPGFGLLLLYGIRDSLEEMQYWRIKAREMGAEFVYAEFEFEVGTIEPKLTDRQLLKATAGKNRFLNLRRMKSELQIQVLESFLTYAESDGEESDENLSRVSQIANRPDLFDRLLVDDRDFAALDILVIPVADDNELPGKMRQLAYVKPCAKVLSILQGSSDVRILLPAWMTDTKMAKELRENGRSLPAPKA